MMSRIRKISLFGWI